MSDQVFAPKLNLSRRPGEPPFNVDMEAFFDFSFWMAEELVDLVAKHELQEKNARRRKHRERIQQIVSQRSRSPNTSDS